MASANILCKKLLNVNNVVIMNHDFSAKQNGVKHLRITVRPNKRAQNRCPICNKKCPGYDSVSEENKVWRGLDWGGIIVEIESPTNRIKCNEHGIVTASVPWAYPGSNFTKDFDLTTAWLATYLPRSTVSNYMRIDWATVGRCISRTLNDIEPERSKRLNGLVNIGIDETSYKKGHKYITVVVNHDTNTVVWASKGHGKSVLEKFYKSLTPEQLSSIKIVTGDGARWITSCVNEFTPDCERCVDPFHVVQWAMEALDEVRREAWREAYAKAQNIAKENPRKRGRPSVSDSISTKVVESKIKASDIKNSTFALGKAPENLTEKQQLKLEMVANTTPKLYRAYCMKENLRLLLKIKSHEEAELELKKWLWWASHSRIPAFIELNKKIRRHKVHILNTIKLGMSNARVEAINNKIKLIVRKAYGFRNIQNMLDMIYLVCSDVEIPLSNREQKLVNAA